MTPPMQDPNFPVTPVIVGKYVFFICVYYDVDVSCHHIQTVADLGPSEEETTYQDAAVIDRPSAGVGGVLIGGPRTPAPPATESIFINCVLT